MTEIKTSNLSFKQINAIKILDKELKRYPFLLINFNELVNDLISERESFRKQRDELINDMAETKRKAKAFDEILNVDYIVAPDDYAHEITKFVDKYKEEQ